MDLLGILADEGTQKLEENSRIELNFLPDTRWLL